MKIGGVQVTSCEELLVLPRPNGEDIPIRAKAVSVNDEFDKICPEPTPPNVRTKEGSKPDFTDKHYRQAQVIRGEQRFAFMVLKSIESSDIDWDGAVDLEKPTTWLKWRGELMKAGISEVECNRIVNLVMSANSLDEAKIEAARQGFLRGQGA